MRRPPPVHYFVFFFFNDTATTEIYTLSLHDALPISRDPLASRASLRTAWKPANPPPTTTTRRRESVVPWPFMRHPLTRIGASKQVAPRAWCGTRRSRYG